MCVSVCVEWRQGFSLIQRHTLGIFAFVIGCLSVYLLSFNKRYEPNKGMGTYRERKCIHHIDYIYCIHIYIRDVNN